ncbi:MAG: hypothetical protein WKI04_09250 [Ferruginibacter sp.]
MKNGFAAHPGIPDISFEKLGTVTDGEIVIDGDNWDSIITQAKIRSCHR